MQILYYSDSTVSVFSLFNGDIASLSLFLALSLSLSMQSPIDREICRSCITDIVPFLCLHCFTDGHSLSLSLLLSLSLSLSMQSPIDREIHRSHITEIVPFLCFQFHGWT